MAYNGAVKNVMCKLWSIYAPARSEFLRPVWKMYVFIQLHMHKMHI